MRCPSDECVRDRPASRRCMPSPAQPLGAAEPDAVLKPPSSQGDRTLMRLRIPNISPLGRMVKAHEERLASTVICASQLGVRAFWYASRCSFARTRQVQLSGGAVIRGGPPFSSAARS